MPYLLIICLSFWLGQRTTVTQWEIYDIELTAQNDYGWWEFPAEAIFTHPDGTRIRLHAFYTGERKWTVRFAPPLSGPWEYQISSSDGGLDGIGGKIQVLPPTPGQVQKNPNLRGHLRISRNGRYFTYHDNTPVLLLGDTNWALNTARCGLGRNHKGPFYQYLGDRKSKGFNTILMAFMRGFGDTSQEPAGQKNDGGYPFKNNNVAQINPAFFQSLDLRMDALWENGFMVAAHPTWFGKMRNCFFDVKWAERISQYLMVRYGAYNILYSLSGEYAYTFRDCNWTEEQVNAIGNAVQAQNPYHHPVSIHPSGRTDWQAPHNVQSSQPFHQTPWLDHNWLQTGQSADRMYNIPARSWENYNLKPVKPFFLSEGFYERSSDDEHAYHARWQIWTAILNGSAGYGYGALGLWQFYDPSDAAGETGKVVRGTIPWWDAIQYEGGSQLQFAYKFFSGLSWWKLHPRPALLQVNNRPTRLPDLHDLSPPHVASTPGMLYICYIPRGNRDNKISLPGLTDGNYEVWWFNPRNGTRSGVEAPQIGSRASLLPDRPDPAEEDWVLVLSYIDE